MAPRMYAACSFAVANAPKAPSMDDYVDSQEVVFLKVRDVSTEAALVETEASSSAEDDQHEIKG